MDAITVTARHATTLLAVETEESGDARAITLRDRTGVVAEELIIEARPSTVAPRATEVAIEIWCGPEVVVGEMHLSPTQWRALAAFAMARAEEAEARE